MSEIAQAPRKLSGETQMTQMVHRCHRRSQSWEASTNQPSIHRTASVIVVLTGSNAQIKVFAYKDFW